MKHTVTAVCCATLVLLAQGALAQQAASKQAAAADPVGSLHGALGKAAPQIRKLLGIINLEPSDVPKNTVGTFFVPNDKAVAAFLKSMGYTADDLATKPHLVDLILSYHFVPGYQVTGSEVARGPKRAATGDENYVVTLDINSEGLLTVKDVQGNIGTVVSGPVKVGKVFVYIIDKVLMSGNYFTDTLAALTFYPSWVTTNGLAQQSGVDKALAASKTPYTLFVPNVKAWKPLEPKIAAASKEQVADVLQYHAVLGSMQIAQDFKEGSLATLLPGQSLKVKVNATATGRDPFRGGAEVVEPLVELTPVVGQPAKVVTYNIYAGKNMIHAIDGVLQPGVTGRTAPVAAGATKAPATVTTEAASKAQPASATTPGPKAAAATPASKTAAVAPSTPQPKATVVPKAAAAAAAPKAATAAAKPHPKAAAPPKTAAPRKTAAATMSMAATAAPVPKSSAAAAQASAGRHLKALAPGRHLRQDGVKDEEQEMKPPEGITVGRTVEIGSLQTSPSGFVNTRLQEALDAAATGAVPIQYINRFGSLPISSAANGCLNCLEWAMP